MDCQNCNSVDCIKEYFSVASVAVSIPKPAFGFTCFKDGEERFSTMQTIGSSYHLIEALDKANPPSEQISSEGTCHSFSKTKITHRVNSYGDLIIGEEYSGTNLSNGAAIYVSAPCGGCCPEGGSITTKASSSYTYDPEYGFSEECQRTDSENFGSPNGCDGSRELSCTDCNGGCGSSPCVGGAEPINCTEARRSESTQSTDLQYKHVDEEEVTSTLSSELSDTFFSLKEEIANKKIDILKDNLPQNAQGLTCPGNQYGCWNVGADNGVIFVHEFENYSENFIFKVCVPTSIAQEADYNIKGKFIITEGSCCDQGATPLREFSFSIGADQFKNGLVCSSDIYFNNSDIKSTKALSFCVTAK